jgi:hypothetical protein
MEKQLYFRILGLRSSLRLAARVLAFVVLLIGIVFVFIRPSVGLYIWVLVLFSMVVTKWLPWLGGLGMILLGVFGLNLLPESNWDYRAQLPFIVLLDTLIFNAALFIAISVLGWTLRIEWPLRK